MISIKWSGVFLGGAVLCAILLTFDSNEFASEIGLESPFKDSLFREGGVWSHARDVAGKLGFFQSTFATRPPSTFVLVGATGDLARKYLWQNIFELFSEGALPENVKIIGAATRPSQEAWLHKTLEEILNCKFLEAELNCDGMGHVGPATGDKSCSDEKQLFINRVRYRQLRESDHYEHLGKELEREYAEEGRQETGRVFYLSISPDFYAQASHFINAHARPKSGTLRVVIEKPFGRDLRSAVDLASTMKGHLKEEEIFVVDHYLSKRGVKLLEDIRSLNPLTLEKYLNKDHVQLIEIVMTERATVEGRTQFYERYGCIRDVLQNHLSAMLSLIAMQLGIEQQQERRTTLLSHVLPPTREEVIVGQYDGYHAHVEQDSQKTDADTPQRIAASTAAATVLRVDLNRWKGVPFLLATGKSLSAREAYLKVLFRSFNSSEAQSEECSLEIHLQGERVGEAVLWSCPGRLILPAGWEKATREHRASARTERFVPLRPDRNAYYYVLDAVVKGRKSHFLGTEEILASWSIWDPVLRRLETEVEGSASGSKLLHRSYSVGDNSFLESAMAELTSVKQRKAL